MNSDQIKGVLQKAGGRIEESAGALVGDESLKEAGREDQIKSDAREAWGNVNDAGDALIDRAKAAKLDAETKSERARAFDRDHRVEIHVMNQARQDGVDQPDRKRVGRINRKGIEKSEQQSFDQPDRKRA